MNGVTHAIGFRREGDHLTSTSSDVAGFVPMQGAGRHRERVFQLSDSNGNRATLRFHSAVPDDVSRLESPPVTPCTEVWSEVTIKTRVSFADLHPWLASSSSLLPPRR